jgi:c(7)-type cytochrome triheme protein
MFGSKHLKGILGAALLAAAGVAASAIGHIDAAARSEKSSAVRAGGAESVQLAQTTPAKAKGPSAANAFNRLMKKRAAKANAPPAEDGIHDPANPGTDVLQWPTEAFQDLPKSPDGNRVDWVRALGDGVISPWFSLDDPKAEPDILDLVIVREVKGSMPDVVFPHEQHGRWLDCANCHDDIFLPEKGANQMSMAGMLLGQECGVCHGTVAFPVPNCRRCHAKPKTPEQLKALAEQSGWRKGAAQAAKPPVAGTKPPVPAK